jgi:pimeloyl-ACP methyl ester carboxylesterase
MKAVFILAAILVLALLGSFLFTLWVARKVVAAFKPLPRVIEIDGERIHYRELGQGPGIVFVHGLGGQAMNFNYLDLDKLAATHRVVLIDRPGSGFSPRRDDGKAGIAAQAALVAGFIRALGFERPPLLVGHSLGGAISLAVALDHADCVGGLALIAPLTHYVPDVPEPFRTLEIRSSFLRNLFAHTLATPLAILNSRKVLDALFGPDATPRDFPVRGGGLLGLRPGGFYGASTDMHGVEKDLPALQERWSGLKLPVDMLYGRGDRVLDWQVQGQGLKDKLSQMTLEVIDGGHMLPVTAVPACQTLIERAAARLN